jgi:hypothetical protein
MPAHLLFKRLADKGSQRRAALGSNQAQALKQLFRGDNRRASHHEAYANPAIMLSCLA